MGVGRGAGIGGGPVVAKGYDRQAEDRRSQGGEASDRDPSFAKRDKGQAGHATVWLSLLEGGGMSA